MFSLSYFLGKRLADVLLLFFCFVLLSAQAKEKEITEKCRYFFFMKPKEIQQNSDLCTVLPRKVRKENTSTTVNASFVFDSNFTTYSGCYAYVLL